MFKIMFRQSFTLNHKTKLLVGLIGLIVFMMACSSPAAEVRETAVPPTEIPPTEIPPTTTPSPDQLLTGAILADDVAEVQRLLEAGADPNLERNGIHPMFVAVNKGNLEVVKLLVAHGGDVTAETVAGKSLIGFAYSSDQFQVAKFLLEQLASTFSMPSSCAATAITPTARLGIDAPVCIMPMGASITEGVCDAPENCRPFDTITPRSPFGLDACSWAQTVFNPNGFGYRAFLPDKFAANGLQMTYVGSVSVIDGFAHEGHSGWTTGDLDYCVQNADWLEKAQPQIILIHVGTNDAIQSRSVDQMVADLKQLLFHIYEKLPATTEVIVAQVIPAADVERWSYIQEPITLFNAQIPEIVGELRASGNHVSYVDMSAVMQSNSEYDAMGIHPNKIASERMADVWLGKIIEILEQPQP